MQHFHIQTWRTLVSKKNASSSWQYFKFKAEENGCNIWVGQYCDMKFWILLKSSRKSEDAALKVFKLMEVKSIISL